MVFFYYEVDVEVGLNTCSGFPRRKSTHSLAEKYFLQMRGSGLLSNIEFVKEISLGVLLSECAGTELCMHRYFYAIASLFCDMSPLTVLMLALDMY